MFLRICMIFLRGWMIILRNSSNSTNLIKKKKFNINILNIYSNLENLIKIIQENQKKDQLDFAVYLNVNGKSLKTNYSLVKGKGQELEEDVVKIEKKMYFKFIIIFISIILIILYC